jgi:hypothetical protein
MSVLQKRRSLKDSPHLSAGGGVLDALMSSFNKSKNKFGRKKKKSSRYLHTHMHTTRTAHAHARTTRTHA